MIVTWEGRQEYKDPCISLGDILESKKSDRYITGILREWWKTKHASQIIPVRHVEFVQTTTTTSKNTGKEQQQQQKEEFKSFRECYCLVTFVIGCQMDVIEIKSIMRPKNERQKQSPGDSSSSSPNITTSWVAVKKSELETSLAEDLWTQIQKDLFFPVHFETFCPVILFVNYRQSINDVKCHPPYPFYRQERIILDKRLRLYDFICQMFGHRNTDLILKMGDTRSCICLKDKCTNITDCLRSIGKRIHEFQTKKQSFGKGEQLWTKAGRDNDTKGFFWVLLLSLYDPHIFHLVMFCEVILTLYKMIVFGWTESDQLRLFEFNNFSSSRHSPTSSGSSNKTKKGNVSSPFWCRIDESSKFNQVHQRYLSENSNRIGSRQQPRWLFHVPIPMLSSFDLNHVTLDDTGDEESSTVPRSSSLFNKSPPMAVMDYTCSYAMVCSLTLNMIRDTVDGLQQKCLKKAVKDCDMIPSLSIEKKTSRGYSFAVGNHTKIRSGIQSSSHTNGFVGLDEGKGGGRGEEEFHHRESSLGGTRVYNLAVLRALFIKKINEALDCYPLFEIYVTKPLVYDRTFQESLSVSKRLNIGISSGGGGSGVGMSKSSRHGGAFAQSTPPISDLPPGYEEFQMMINSGIEPEQEEGDGYDDDDEEENSIELFPPCVAQIIDRKTGHPKYKERFFILSFLFDVGLPVPVIAQIYKSTFKDREFASMSFVRFYKDTEYGPSFLSTMKTLQKYKKESGYPFVGNSCCNLISNGFCAFPATGSDSASCTDIEDLGQNYTCAPSSSSNRAFGSNQRQGIDECQRKPEEHKYRKMMCAMNAARETGKRPRNLFRRPVDNFAHNDAIRRERDQEEIDQMKGNQMGDIDG